ncbi:NUDIX domain-containing protein [Lactococcus nasutitermitis]|uniref:NUDIX domain-containing protein n=1 Tax=Lactococcus nasutitermitis TaxID=1652957 RepID=A0ABV9JDE2_9LACT|nr:NUDIX domain-containing protein [Lactococcus nasutitermitis]
MNDKLIKQIQGLLAFEDEEKLNKICNILAHTDVELKGKSNPNLQLSASAVVFYGEKMVFIEHPYQLEILLPAGHVELGEEPVETAFREFHEETGFFAENPTRLIDVNLIEIPFNKVKNEQAHLHIDFRYLLTLSPQKSEQEELPYFLLDEQEAPLEFRKYYKYHLSIS